MRLAALIHKPRCGPRAMHAAQVLRMATHGGARALGLGGSLGTLEPGKLADVIAVDTSGPHAVPADDPHSAVVYACRSADVRHVVVDGRVIVRDRQLLTLDRAAVVQGARTHARKLFARI
jgi:cytosine/adenosine deaminase-related metal-dependent hydrolase